MQCDNCHSLWLARNGTKNYQNCGFSKHSPILIEYIHPDKIVVIDHGTIPRCSKCKFVMHTFIKVSEPITVHTGTIPPQNTAVTFYPAPVSIFLKFQFKIVNIERFGTALIDYNTWGANTLLYFPINSITDIGCDTVCLIDNVPASHFMCCDGRHVMINRHGEAIWPEWIWEQGNKYESNNFTIFYDTVKKEWIYEAAPSMHTKAAIKE